MRSRIAGGMPGPLSAIAIDSASRCSAPGQRHVARDARREHDRGAAVVPMSACAALRTTFSTACISCSGSASMSGQRDVEVGLDRDRRELGLHHALHPHQDLVDVGAPVGRYPVRREQPVDERLQAVGLVDDHLRVLGELRPVELALEELRRAADAAERVLDLVREAADQLAIGLLLLELAFLARDLQLLVDLAELQHQRDVLVLDRRDGDGEVRALLAGHAELELLLRVGGARRERVVDGAGEEPRVHEQRADRIAREARRGTARTGARRPGSRSARRAPGTGAAPRSRASRGPARAPAPPRAATGRATSAAAAPRWTG